MIAIVFGLIFKIVFLLAVGFVMKKKGVLSSQDQKSMTTVLMKIVVFFMIIMSSQNTFSLDAARAIGITGIVAIVTYAVGIPLAAILAKRLGLPGERQRIFVMSAMFCNVTFMGYPICQELFGDVGLLCAIMYSMVYNILFYTWGFAYLDGTGKMNTSPFLRIKWPSVLCWPLSCILPRLRFRSLLQAHLRLSVP